MENQIIIFDQSQIEKEIRLAAIAAKYQDILNNVAEIEFTRENVSQDLLAPARNVLAALKAKKDEIKRPHLDANTKAEEIFKQLSAPLEQLLKEKLFQKTQIAEQIQRENAEIEAEKRRIEEVTKYINNFFTESINWLLKNGRTSKDIVTLERRIGVELSRKTYYGGLYYTFVEKCDKIREIIAERKDFIRKSEELDRKLAETAANEEKKAKILEEKEDLSIFLLTNKTELQENAVITSADFGLTLGETENIDISARRQWTYEITDIHDLYRRYPNLVKLEPDTAAIRAFSNQIRREEKNKGKEEIRLTGIRLYQEKKYK